MSGLPPPSSPGFARGHHLPQAEPEAFAKAVMALIKP
jgi:hypothetical protein